MWLHIYMRRFRFESFGWRCLVLLLLLELGCPQVMRVCPLGCVGALFAVLAFDGYTVEGFGSDWAVFLGYPLAICGAWSKTCMFIWGSMCVSQPVCIIFLMYFVCWVVGMSFVLCGFMLRV